MERRTSAFSHCGTPLRAASITNDDDDDVGRRRGSPAAFIPAGYIRKVKIRELLSK